jgi:hypothetical protein
MAIFRLASPEDPMFNEGPQSYSPHWAVSRHRSADNVAQPKKQQSRDGLFIAPHLGLVPR